MLSTAIQKDVDGQDTEVSEGLPSIVLVVHAPKVLATVVPWSPTAIQNVTDGHDTEESGAEDFWIGDDHAVPLKDVTYPSELTDSQNVVVTHETLVAVPVANSKVVADPVVVPESGTTVHGVRITQ